MYSMLSTERILEADPLPRLESPGFEIPGFRLDRDERAFRSHRSPMRRADGLLLKDHHVARQEGEIEPLFHIPRMELVARTDHREHEQHVVFDARPVLKPFGLRFVGLEDEDAHS